MKKVTFSNIVFTGLFVILCLATLFLSFHSKKLNRKIDEVQSVSNANQEISVATYINQLTSYYSNESKRVSDSLLVYSFNDQDSVTLKSIIRKGPHLILRVSKGDCDSCLDSIFATLRQSFTNISTKNILLLTNEENPRRIIVYQRIHGVSYRVYHLGQGLFPVTFDSYTPYFFIVDSSLTIQMLYKVEPQIPQLTEDYINIIVDRYFR